MFGKNLPRQGRRQPIKASTLNDAAQSVEGVFRLRTGGTQWTIDGTPLGLPSSTNPIALIKTTGTITARSGTTPGTGNGVFVTWDGSAITAGTTTITLKNISAKTGGISSGKYGYAVQIGADWFVVSVEC